MIHLKIVRRMSHLQVIYKETLKKIVKAIFEIFCSSLISDSPCLLIFQIFHQNLKILCAQLGLMLHIQFGCSFLFVLQIGWSKFPITRAHTDPSPPPFFFQSLVTTKYESQMKIRYWNFWSSTILPLVMVVRQRK